MFIHLLELEHFDGIEATMHVQKITIDFSKQKHGICLITGPNGKGKTVLLSQLNPFATLGNVDVRDDLDLIIEGKNGHKKIIIIDNGNEYEIDHFYTPTKTSHSIKSFIKKNGEELNPNGNVTSFKLIVKAELDIEQDYMKLVRLGNNVTNIISLRSSERKTFMSKLLEDANIYLKHFAKVGGDVTKLKALISHLSDKIRKTNIDNPEEAKELIASGESSLSKLTSELENITEKLNVVNFQLKDLPSDMEFELTQISLSLKKLKAYKNISVGELDEKKQNLQVVIAKKTARKEFLEEQIRSISDDINISARELAIAEENLDQLLSSVDTYGLKDLIANLEARVAEEKMTYSVMEVQPTHHKEDIEELLVFLREKQELLTTTYEFGREPIQKVVSLIKEARDVTDYCDKKLAQIALEQDDRDARRFVNRLLNKKPNMTIPKDCPGNCIMTGVFSEMRRILKTSDDKKEKSKEFYDYMKLAYLHIKSVLVSFGTKEELFMRLPEYIQKMFLTNTILDHIARVEWIYDQKVLFNELSFITDYDNYLNDCDLLAEKKEELVKYTKDMPISSMEAEVSSLTSKLDSLKSRKKTLIDEFDSISEEIRRNEKELSDIIDISSIVRKKDEFLKTQSELEMKCGKRRELLRDRDEFNRRKAYLDADIKRITDAITSMTFNLKQYKSLMKELKSYQEIYDDMVLIRESLSSNTGIPLVFIDIYLAEAKETVNDLMYEIYKGSMEIDRFNIKAEEFTIPFIKDGKVVDDIKYASQGEQSFFLIALSFAISYRSMSRYNIMLLDELDSVLDESNRSGFISIVEKLRTIIHAEQTFVISHNNMFSMYPVDYISVVDKKPEGMPHANYIEIRKER